MNRKKKDLWKKLLNYLGTFLIGIVIGIAIQPITESFVNSFLFPPKIQVIAVSSINVYGDEDFNSEGRINTLKSYFGVDNHFRTGQNGECYYDFAFPPFIKKEVFFDKLFLQYDPQNLSQKYHNLKQNFFVINNGKGSVENFRMTICYGYSILNTSSEIILLSDNCVWFEKEKLIPSASKNIPVQKLEWVELKLNRTMLNTEKIILSVNLEYYSKIGIFEGWHRLDSDNFLHWGSIISDACPPHPLAMNLISRVPVIVQ